MTDQQTFRAVRVSRYRRRDDDTALLALALAMLELTGDWFRAMRPPAPRPDCGECGGYCDRTCGACGGQSDISAGCVCSAGLVACDACGGTGEAFELDLDGQRVPVGMTRALARPVAPDIVLLELAIRLQGWAFYRSRGQAHGDVMSAAECADLGVPAAAYVRAYFRGGEALVFVATVWAATEYGAVVAVGTPLPSRLIRRSYDLHTGGMYRGAAC